jgi:hypothetical protein
MKDCDPRSLHRARVTTMPRSSMLTNPLPVPCLCQSRPTSSLRRSAPVQPSTNKTVSRAPKAVLTSSPSSVSSPEAQRLPPGQAGGCGKGRAKAAPSPFVGRQPESQPCWLLRKAANEDASAPEVITELDR